MLNRVVAALAMVMAGGGPAEPGHLRSDVSVQQWHDAYQVCRLGIDREGAAVPEYERDTVCHALIRFRTVLIESDHCWSELEQQWLPSGRGDGSCDRVAGAR